MTEKNRKTNFHLRLSPVMFYKVKKVFLNGWVAVFGICFLMYCRTAAVPGNLTSASFYTVDSTLTPDPGIEKKIAPFREKLLTAMRETLAVLETEAVKGKPESPLGNLTCDLLISAAQPCADTAQPAAPWICIMNSGGLRVALPAGPVTVGQVYELMPFENRLVALLIRQEAFQELQRYVAARHGEPIGGFRLVVRNGLPVDCQLRDTKCSDAAQVWVVTSDYLADGGDKMGFLKNPIRRLDLGVTVREALIRSLKARSASGLSSITPARDGRVTILSAEP